MISFFYSLLSDNYPKMLEITDVYVKNKISYSNDDKKKKQNNLV